MADDIGSFSTMLRAALGSRLAADADSFIDMVAADVVMEFPFAPPGMVRRLDGRDAIAQHLEGLSGLIAFDGMGEAVVHRSTDPDLFVLEFEGFGTGVETGEPYAQTYISVIRLRAGRIVAYRDYWNPLVVLRTLRGAAVIDGLIGGGDHG